MNIRDSGERTTFSTGAQRDMHSGKGRMDLLPWAAIIEVSKLGRSSTGCIMSIKGSPPAV